MCPMCYINGLLFLIFGASGVAIANNPWVIAIGVISVSYTHLTLPTTPYV